MARDLQSRTAAATTRSSSSRQREERLHSEGAISSSEASATVPLPPMEVAATADQQDNVVFKAAEDEADLDHDGDDEGDDEGEDLDDKMFD